MRGLTKQIVFYVVASARIVALVLTLLALPAQVRAGPILLAQMSDKLGQGGSFASFSDLTTEAFGLVYDLQGNWQAFPDGAEICVGCHLLLPIRTTGTFDFDASNDPEFTSFVQRLTNGTDELLWTVAFALDTSGNVVGAGGGGNFESRWFGTPTDLFGRQIDLIRLTVNSFDLGPNSSGTPGNPGFFYSADLTWQFWGSGAPAPVPEPSSLLLLTCGIAGLAAVGRWLLP